MLRPHAFRMAAQGVAERISPIEHAIDTTLAQTAGLLAFLPQARMDANLPATTGHDAIRHVVASINAIVQARTEFLAAHAEFSATGEELGLRETGMGSLGGCPPASGLSLARVA